MKPQSIWHTGWLRKLIASSSNSFGKGSLLQI
jgi:hypothetical protein